MNKSFLKGMIYISKIGIVTYIGNKNGDTSQILTNICLSYLKRHGIIDNYVTNDSCNYLENCYNKHTNIKE